MKRFVLLVGDAVLFQAALVLTLLLRYGQLDQAHWRLHFTPFVVITLLWIVGFYIVGLYDLTNQQNDLKFFRRYLEGMIANLALAFAFFYLIPVFGIAPRTNLFLYFAIVLLLDYGWRLVYNRYIAAALFKNRLLFIGRATDVAKIAALIKKTALGFQLVAVIETEVEERPNDASITWYHLSDGLEQVIKKEEIDTILLGHRPDDIPGLRDALYRTLFLHVTLLDRATLEETITGRVPLEYVSETWFLEHLKESEKAWFEAFKRVMDIVISIPFGLMTIIFFPFIALAIKLSSHGTVLYSQVRIGKMGKEFEIWKFRTMRQDAEVEGKPQFASKGDPRITGVGSFLRASRLDELPQIWNVLRGDMSLIGPRPERPPFVDELTRQMSYYALRHLTRPGLTGWAQVKFPYAGTLEDNLKKLQYDLFYIKHRSLLLDIAILLKTIGIVLRRQGT